MHRLNSFGSLISKSLLFNGIKNNSKILPNLKSQRTFLTDNYYCYEEWDQYLLSDIVKNVGTVNSFSIEIDNKLTQKSLVTPFDMDLLAAKTVYISNFQELEFVENIFSNFRKTQASLYVRDSMHYSLARSYIDLNQHERFLQILKLKYKYGIFIDSYTANMLIDRFIKQKDFRNAALTAHEVMLQEFNENQLTLAACLYSCFKYIHETKGKEEPVAEETGNENDKPEKILVYFLRKPYNDEHFDLRSIPRLCGKTIVYAVNNLNSLDPVLSNSLKIYGLLLHEKFDLAIELFENLYLKNKQALNLIVLEKFKQISEKLSNNEEDSKKYEQFLTRLMEITKLIEKNNPNKFLENDVSIDLLKYLENMSKTNTDKDVNEQKDLLKKWKNEQEQELKKQLRNVTIEMKKASILKRLESLEKQEELLTFFDHQQKIINAYHDKGFVDEDPAKIPIEPEESKFQAKFQRHFKPWPKYANPPPINEELEKTRKEVSETLSKIYLNNRKAQTTPINKLITSAKKSLISKN